MTSWVEKDGTHLQEPFLYNTEWLVEDRLMGVKEAWSPVHPGFPIAIQHFYCTQCGVVYATALPDYPDAYHEMIEGCCKDCTSYNSEFPSGSVLACGQRVLTNAGPETFLDNWGFNLRCDRINWDIYPTQILKYEFLVRYNHAKRCGTI